MNVIKYKYLFLGFSGLLLIASIVAVSIFGLKQGIDFVGGSLWQVSSGISHNSQDLEELQKIMPKEAVINLSGDMSDYIIRMSEISEEDHQKYLKQLNEKGFQELSFESIGSAIGNELRTKSIWAFIVVLMTISLYISFAFRKVSRPVSSWKYGIITLLTLFHDATIPVGLFAILGYLYGAEIGTNFIVAILVIMGFSVHDTIVVFDRIRENLRLEKSGNFVFANTVNRSINQTFARSINTSLTLVLVLLAIYFLGASSLNYFILTIFVGTIFGTYSSIFIASPLLVLWSKNKI